MSIWPAYTVMNLLIMGRVLSQLERRSASRLLPGMPRRSNHQLLGQIGEFERSAPGVLREIGGRGMPAVDILVIEEREAHGRHLCRHLAGMPGMHPVVLGR